MTDHRLGLSLSALDRILEGDAEPGLNNLIEALAEYADDLRLAALHEQLLAAAEAASAPVGKGKGKK